MTAAECESKCPMYEQLSAVFGEADGGLLGLQGDTLGGRNVANKLFA